MFRRRKNGLRSRWIIIVLLLVIFVIFTGGPLIWRMQQLNHARNMYDMYKVQENLLWIENKGLLKNLAVVKDTRLWLALNMGSGGLDESELASYQDDKHQFWLTLYYLQKGELTLAQGVLDNISESNLKQLGKGLISLSKGDAQESQQLLLGNDRDWKNLAINEQCIRHLTLAQAALSRGDYQMTRAELQTAQQLNPNNPACLSLAFNVAIADEQWAKAIELSQQIDAQTWRPANLLYETQKAVLAIHEGNSLRLSQCLSAMKELQQGEACIKYVNGIKALAEGDLELGKSLLEKALKEGLEGELFNDAQQTLNQIIERQKAEKNLRSIVAQMNEQW